MFLLCLISHYYVLLCLLLYLIMSYYFLTFSPSLPNLSSLYERSLWPPLHRFICRRERTYFPLVKFHQDWFLLQAFFHIFNSTFATNRLWGLWTLPLWKISTTYEGRTFQYVSQVAILGHFSQKKKFCLRKLFLLFFICLHYLGKPVQLLYKLNLFSVYRLY